MKFIKKEEKITPQLKKIYKDIKIFKKIYKDNAAFEHICLIARSNAIKLKHKFDLNAPILYMSRSLLL